MMMNFFEKDFEINYEVDTVFKFRMWMFGFVCISCFLWVFLFYSGYQKMNFLNNAKLVSAVVTQVGCNAPIYNFDVDNNNMIVTSRIQSCPARHFTGEKIMIFYNPLKPYDVLETSFFNKWFLEICTTFMAIMFSLATVFGYKHIKRKISCSNGKSKNDIFINNPRAVLRLKR